MNTCCRLWIQERYGINNEFNLKVGGLALKDTTWKQLDLAVPKKRNSTKKGSKSKHMQAGQHKLGVGTGGQGCSLRARVEGSWNWVGCWGCEGTAGAWSWAWGQESYPSAGKGWNNGEAIWHHQPNSKHNDKLTSLCFWTAILSLTTHCHSPPSPTCWLVLTSTNSHWSVINPMTHSQTAGTKLKLTTVLRAPVPELWGPASGPSLGPPLVERSMQTTNGVVSPGFNAEPDPSSVSNFLQLLLNCHEIDSHCYKQSSESGSRAMRDQK